MFTLIIPALMAGDEMPLPPLNTPALNQLRRFARFQAHDLTTAQLYQRFLCDRLALDECSAYASPVVQQMGMNSVQMLDLKAACTDLPPETAQQYADRLNQEYAGEYRWQILRPDVWQITSKRLLDWPDISIWQACGRLNPLMQAASPDWLQLSTELQMWLHGTDNAPFNAFWLWRAAAGQPFEPCALIGTDSPWQQQSSLHTAAEPQNWPAWQHECAAQNTAPEDTHLFLDGLTQCAQIGDALLYQQQIHAYEERFFAPIWQTLCQGSLHHWRLVCEQGQWLIDRKPQRWAFWRRSTPFDGKTLP